MIYGIRSNGNSHGLVITKPVVVKTMLDRVGYTHDTDLRTIKVIEPAAGDGAFATEIIDRLFLSSIQFNFSFQSALSNITFYEIDAKMASILHERIRTLLLGYSACMPPGMVRVEDFLLAATEKCDLVVGNPPYVRHENIPDKQKTLYRRSFKTFKDRSDLFIGFYEKGLSMLDHHGVLSFICSNRWLKNQYGRHLRELIMNHYSLEEIIDLEETCPFEEEVIAYPAITTIRNTEKSGHTHYYKITSINELSHLNPENKNHRLLHVIHSANWFAMESKEYTNSGELETIESQGFSIGIGVATGSDKVFIRRDFQTSVEKELLIPLLISKDLRNNSLNWSGNYILNPFEVNGKLIELNKYPKAQKYFDAHKDVLVNRHISKRNPKFWYKTIDRINPVLISQNKIILPDISGNTHLLIDRGKYYPHHNLYYITGRGYDDLVILAALLMSDFVKNQLLEQGIKMNGGYPRWQSQNLKKLQLPIINAIPQAVKEKIRNAYHSMDYGVINSLTSEDKIALYKPPVRQTVLF